MKEGTTAEAEVIRLREDISSLLRRRVLEAIERTLEEERTEALGIGRYERSGARLGYRNGHERRRNTTEVGVQTLAVPRGRIVGEDGSTREFRSQVVPRYARRTRKVDEATWARTWPEPTRDASARRSNPCSARSTCRRARSRGSRRG